ncbi:universal stress protein [Nonomuraea sp. NPDC049141]|uniref:universal stress protein n=1 Tax=Nonomuraea sp. NPDC049141 TaxID=3155500 RepID=UPI0033F2E4D9
MIVVGVDGLRAGFEAVGWAAVEAALRESPLTVAHVLPRWVCETERGASGRCKCWRPNASMRAPPFERSATSLLHISS